MKEEEEEIKINRPNCRIIKPWWLPNILFNKLELEQIHICERFKFDASEKTILQAPNGDIVDIYNQQP